MSRIVEVAARVACAGVLLSVADRLPAQQTTPAHAIYTQIHAFDPQDNGPEGGGFILGKDGNFYGTTWGPPGTLYRISATGAYQLLHTFDPTADGEEPYGPLAMDPGGAIYGTTATNTSFRYTTDGVFTSFGPLPGGSNAGFKPNGLIYATDGNLYGTASGGNGGQVFRLTPQGVSTVIASFVANLPPVLTPNFFVQGLDGALYGVLLGGSNPFIRMTLDGNYTVVTDLGSPSNSNQYGPGILVANDGNFYVEDGYVLAEITPAGVVSTSAPVGSAMFLDFVPTAPIIQATDSALYSFGPGAGAEYIAQINSDLSFNLYVPETGAMVPGFLTAITQGPDASLYGVSGGSAGSAIYRITLIPGSTTSSSGGGGSGSSTFVDPDSSAGDGVPDDGSGDDYGVTMALGDPGDVSGSPCAGDPVCVASGNLFETVTDYQTAGPNPLSFTRYYNSIASPNTLATTLGTNWRSNYDRYLQIGINTVIAERADGQRVTFNRVGTEWITEAYIDLQLLNTGTVWSITDSTDASEVYTSVNAGEALLTSIQARNGYTQKLQYGTVSASLSAAVGGNGYTPKLHPGPGDLRGTIYPVGYTSKLQFGPGNLPGNVLISVTDSFNRTLSFTYNGGLLETVSTPDLQPALGYGFTGGVLTSVSYFGPGQLSRELSEAAHRGPETSQTYLYENPALPASLTGIIDENGGRYATWTYDAAGRVLTSQNGAGANLTTFAYNPDGTRAITNPLGEQEVYKFVTVLGVSKVSEIDRVATASLPAATRKFTYDANGCLASRTDWNGNLTTYVNDNRGEPTTINEAVGTPQARKTSITYHPIFHLPTQIQTAGLTTAYTYDFNGQLLTKTLTDTTTTAAPYSTAGQTRKWTYTWSNFLLASVQTPRTDVAEVTHFTYDSTGALISTTNALGHAVQTTRHLPGGLPVTTVDVNGVTRNLTYDTRNWLRKTSLSAGEHVNTGFTYDAAGNLIATTLPDGSQTSNTYDSAHRLTGYTNLFNEGVSYKLDAAGDVTQSVTTGSNGKTQRTHSAVFDPLGRLQQDIGAAGQTTAYTYDANGNAISMTDPLGHVTRQSFDALNHRVSITDANGGVTTIAYDAHGRPTTITDANGGVTTNVYDGFGDLIQHTSPDTGTTVAQYDQDGNVVQRTDARGVMAQYTYDAIDRVLTTSYPGNPAENVTFTYDQGTFGIGRLTGVADPAGTLARSYDARGNLLSEIRTNGAASLATSYLYDAASHVTAITYPSGWTATYSRDAMGRVTAITAQASGGAASPVIAGIRYQPLGPVNSLMYGNGVADSRTFDLDYRLTALAEAGTKPLENLAYAYDAANNVTAITDGVTSSNSQSFKYDILDRMIGAAGGYGNYGYTYDGVSNRLSESLGSSTTAYSYTAHANQLASVSAGGASQAIGYDKAGNITGYGSSAGPITASYNQSGRLAAVMSGSNMLAQYTYDAFGQRVARVGSVTATTFFQYSQNGRLLEETDGAGNAQVDYVYLGSMPVATISPSTRQISFLHDDRLGTPQSATDSGQNVVWTANYGPFGELSTTPALIVQNLRLPGQEFDANTGLYHNGFRDYVPQWGRYLQSDPRGIAAGVNTYGYVQANPAKFVDTQGLVSGPVQEGIGQFADYVLEKPFVTALAQKTNLNVSQETTQAIAAGIIGGTFQAVLAIPEIVASAPEDAACPECVLAALGSEFALGAYNGVKDEELAGNEWSALNAIANGFNSLQNSSDFPFVDPAASPASNLVGIANPMSPDWGPNYAALGAEFGPPAPWVPQSSLGDFSGTNFGFYVSDYLTNPLPSVGGPCSP